MPQIARIFTHYALDTPWSLYESHVSVVDMVNIFRRTKSMGYPFLCLVWEDEPHIVLGFLYAATEMYRLTKFPGVVVNLLFVDPEKRGLGIFDKLVLPYITELVKNPHFRAAWSDTNYGNRHVRHKHSPAYIVGHQPPTVHRNGGFKFGNFIDMGYEAWNKSTFLTLIENSKEFFKFQEHL
jgi:L-amino acid N-acyltransferase YncA